MLYDAPSHGGNRKQGIRWDFSISLNPLGIPPEVQEAVVRAMRQTPRYPDPLCLELRQALAERLDISPDRIFCGNGAAECIDAFARARKWSCALIWQPCFGEYERAFCACGVRVRSALSVDAAAFAAEIADLPIHSAVVVCSPASPFGTIVGCEAIELLVDACERRDCTLLLDECFIELSDDPAGAWERVKARASVCVLRAFTKTYAMAGLRLGYLVSDDRALLRDMAAQVQPWNVSHLAQCAGVAALSQRDYLQRARKMIRTQRSQMIDAMRAIGVVCYDSQSNYFVWRARSGLDRQLERYAIAVRSCADFIGLDDTYYRVCVRTPSENERFLQVLEEIL